MNNLKSVYFIGIKGVGMTALAIYFKQKGIEVTGSDVKEIFVTDKLLRNADIKVIDGFDSRNIKKYDLIVASAAYDQNNPEIAEAKKRHLNIKDYSDVLGEISAEQKVIAVSGIHGKTTTTAMLSYILEKSHFDPSYIIGSGEVPNLEFNAQYGKGDFFIIEADEYRKNSEDINPKFLSLNPYAAIITSIELDHPDIYQTIEDVYDAFYRLVCRVPRSGFIVLCADYPKCLKLKQTIADREFETYGFSPASKWKIINNHQKINGSIFSIQGPDKQYGPFELKIGGNHNILNATAAIITSLKIGVSEKEIIKNINSFKNVKRRLEEIAKFDNIIIFDDYAHHPTAIATTLDTLKKTYPDYKIWCIFQPHTYTRTEKLLSSFGKSFKNADKVFITDIFASAREKPTSITSVNLVEEIKKYQNSVKFADDLDKLEDYIVGSIKNPTILITIGAGDIYKVAEHLKKKYSKVKYGQLSFKSTTKKV